MDNTNTQMASASALDWAHPIVREWFLSRLGVPTEPQEQGWPHILRGTTTLISAPTGSGKTLAAFLTCIDRMVRKALAGELQDRTEVLYVSPLKALGNDIKTNLEVPLGEIQRLAMERGLLMPEIRAAVRTGDTLMHERRAMLQRPPHILVTTPESLYILLTAEKSREMLKTVNTVIVDEIHAVADDKRGTHLALSLERLEALTDRPTAANRIVGYAKTNSVDRTFSDRQRPAGPGDCADRASTTSGPGSGSAGERTGAGGYARNVGRNLRPRRRTGAAAPIDAGVCEYAQAGGARGASFGGAIGRAMRWRRITGACRGNCGWRRKRS